jgi:hypothetical protein
MRRLALVALFAVSISATSAVAEHSRDAIHLVQYQPNALLQPDGRTMDMSNRDMLELLQQGQDRVNASTPSQVPRPQPLGGAPHLDGCWPKPFSGMDCK